VDLVRYTVDLEARYLAFVLKGPGCEVVRVELGTAAALDDTASAWHEVLRDPSALPERVRHRGLALSGLLLDPLLEEVGDRKHWLIVPDGPLATIPIGALPTGDGYAIEHYLMTYLDRANDLLRPRSPSGEGAVVIGDVDYDASRSTEGAPRSFLAPCNGGDFGALPGTAAETEQIAGRWTRFRRSESISTLGGESATESAVASALEGKALAHIATHGFFATGDCRSALADGIGYDPMVLSGLVLAGANRSADARSPEDGILTAGEVATLDLSGTDLVVLSACETGLGEIQSGQGVLGLRRGFAIAGARTLVMSLWAVPDEETTALMDAFYRRHLRRRGMPAAQALRAAQLERLAKQRSEGAEHPFEWAAFIASGGSGL